MQSNKIEIFKNLIKKIEITISFLEEMKWKMI